MTDAKHYSMIIQWDAEDQIYVVSVPELPGCMTHGKTYKKAVKQGQDAIESWIKVAKELGKPVPPPRVMDYSRDASVLNNLSLMA